MGNPNPTVSKRCSMPLEPGETVGEYEAGCFGKAYSLNDRGLKTTNQMGVGFRIFHDVSSWMHKSHHLLEKNKPLEYLFSSYEEGLSLLVDTFFKLAKESTISALRSAINGLKMGNANIRNKCK